MRYARTVLELVGHTPLVKLNHVVPQGPDAPLVLAKMEAFNPGGSVKDRIGLSMIEAEEKAGRLKPGGTVVEGTSGNTGIGLALAAASRGYRVVFTMPDKMSAEKERLLRAYGAEVVRCPTNVSAEDPRSYYEVAKRIAAETPGAVYPNQYDHQANPEAHYRSTGPEIWADTDGRVTHYVVGTGTGGTVSGTGRFLKEKNAKVKVVAVDPVGSILTKYHQTGKIDQTIGKTYKIEGIGEDIIPKATWFQYIDDFVQVSDAEAYAMALRMAKEEGVLCGSSGGAAIAGVAKYIEKARPGKDAVIVTLIPDSGERYLSKLHNPSWLRANGFLPPARTAGDVAMRPPPSVGPDEPARRILDLAIARVTPVVVLDRGDQSDSGFVVDDVRASALAEPDILKAGAGRLHAAGLARIEASKPLTAAAAQLQHYPAAIITDGGKVVGLADRASVLSGLGVG